MFNSKILICIAVAFCLVGPAQAQVPMTGAGAGAPGLALPGNVISGATKAWSIARAYNLAYGANAAADICDVATGLVCSTVNYLSTGLFDAATAAALTQCATSCNVSKLYDSTGNGQHFIQATNANRPVLTFNCLNTSIPCLTFNGTSQRMTGTATGTQTSPYSISSVWNCTSSGNQKPVFKDSAGFNGIQCIATTNNYEVYAGTSNSVAETAGTWHTFMGIINGASGVAVVDTTTTTANTGTGTFGTALQLGTNNSSQFFSGKWTELIFYPSALSAGNTTSLHNNQCAYYGTTC